MKRLARDVILLALATGISRVFGLFRDMTIADRFGAGAAYDAFLIAFFLPHFLRRLLAEGALDVFAQPVQMKKGRPGVVLTCLAGDGDVARLEGVLFRETTTFGVRKHPVDRVKLQREQRTVETPYGSVRVKVGRRGGDVMTISPEYEDCRRLASARGVPLRRVYDAASRAAQEAS